MTRLGDLKKGQQGTIKTIHFGSSAKEQKIAQRLIEMGLREGLCVAVEHEAPLSKDPIAIRARGELLGLGRAEARQIELEGVSPCT